MRERNKLCVGCLTELIELISSRSDLRCGRLRAITERERERQTDREKRDREERERQREKKERERDRNGRRQIYVAEDYAPLQLHCRGTRDACCSGCRGVGGHSTELSHICIC